MIGLLLAVTVVKGGLVVDCLNVIAFKVIVTIPF